MGHQRPDELQTSHAALIEHPLYARVRDLPSLRAFMESHVFAVWDFMTLLKTLQRKVTCVDTPWLPAADARSARLINEIVLAEESDALPDGRVASHFELYVEAMEEVGADTSKIKTFLRELRAGTPADEALLKIKAPGEAAAFTVTTLAIAGRGTTEEVAAAFLYGREDVIPEMFEKILAEIETTLKRECPGLRTYLERHIHIDKDEHGPAAALLLQSLCGDDVARQRSALRAAHGALRARLKLWDGLEARINDLP